MTFAPFLIVDKSEVYIRFQGQKQNETSASKLGIFQLAFELRDEGDLPRYVLTELIENIEWLRANLHSPEILDKDEHHRAISWFLPTAHEPISRVRSMAAILNEYGYHIEQVQARDPGIVIYEDEFQVVAKPRRKST